MEPVDSAKHSCLSFVDLVLLENKLFRVCMGSVPDCPLILGFDWSQFGIGTGPDWGQLVSTSECAIGGVVGAVVVVGCKHCNWKQLVAAPGCEIGREVAVVVVVDCRDCGIADESILEYFGMTDSSLS